MPFCMAAGQASIRKIYIRKISRLDVFVSDFVILIETENSAVTILTCKQRRKKHIFCSSRSISTDYRDIETGEQKNGYRKTTVID